MSDFYYVRCAGDGSWLSKLGQGGRGDEFTLSLDQALPLKKHEANNAGYPSAVYSLVPTEGDVLLLIERAIHVIMHAPGGHQDIADGLAASLSKLRGAIDEAGDALGGDSNDAEHDALYTLMEALGQSVEGGD